MMIRRKAIYIFLGALLFALNNNDVSYMAITPGHAAASSVFGSAQNTFTFSCIPAISNLVVIKDHIRVRYMGGEIGFTPSAFPVNIRPAEFADNPVSTKNCFFAPRGGEFLFKLRGPPLC